jgi:hypothetical protein
MSGLFRAARRFGTIVPAGVGIGRTGHAQRLWVGAR